MDEQEGRGDLRQSADHRPEIESAVRHRQLMPAYAPKQDEVEKRESSPKPKRTKVAPVVAHDALQVLLHGGADILKEGAATVMRTQVSIFAASTQAEKNPWPIGVQVNKPFCFARPPVS